ncbi:MAG: hypothetical protein WDM90_21495 [Ferruginibacter sp.]
MNQIFFSYQNVSTTTDADEKIQMLNLLSKNYPQSVAALYAKLELKKIDAFTKKTRCKQY